MTQTATLQPDALLRRALAFLKRRFDVVNDDEAFELHEAICTSLVPPHPMTGPNHGSSIPEQFRLLRSLIGTQYPEGLQNMRDIIAYIESVCPKLEPTPADETEIATARELYGSDEIEIDDDAEASCTEEGSWVAAWVWISDAEIAGEKTPMPDAIS